MHRRSMLTGLTTLAALAMAPAVARAAERQPFTDAAFDAAQAAGRPVLVDVSAPWCPTCRAQRPHIDAMAADPRMKEAIFLSVDFDSQKEALRRLNVRSQSTLIAFKGRELPQLQSHDGIGLAFRHAVFRQVAQFAGECRKTVFT